MSARSHRLRVRLLGTIGVLWLAAMSLVGFRLVDTAESVNQYEMQADRSLYEFNLQKWNEKCEAERMSLPFNIRSLPVTAKETPCNSAFPTFTEWCDGRKFLCEDLVKVGEKTVYDWSAALAGAGAATLVAGVLVAAVMIWTRPEDDDASPATTAVPKKSSPSPKPAPADQAARPAATSATKNPASVADQLRQLKGLHDDGILTDEEYETKRKALTDQL